MKKHILTLVSVAFGLLLLAACSREHKCKCTYNDTPNDDQYKVFVVDGSISCDDIVLTSS